MQNTRPTREELQEALGANPPIAVRTVAHGPFGALQLSKELAERLRPGKGIRPGRPTSPDWKIRRLVGFRDETWSKLTEMAKEASTPQRKVSPAQMAAILIETSVEHLQKS